MTTVGAQDRPSLRPTVLVAGDLVRIGDLVADVAPEKADIAVFRAPDLGQTGSVRTAAVIEALRPHDVAVEASGLTEVSVTRASRMIGAIEIKDRVATIAAERLRLSDTASIAVTLDGPAPTLHLDPAETGPLIPVRALFEPRGGRFELVFRTGASHLRVTGTAQEIHDAVVLRRAVARGDVLREDDVALEKRPKAEVQADAVRDTAAAVGMALQQTLRPGQVIRSHDLVRPQLVKRGEPVIIVYEVPGITLTVRGKMEDSGSLDDTVNVLNVQSKRVIQGVVSGPGQVTVTALTPRIVSAAQNRDANRIANARTALTKAE
ncbi:MAG: flagellar basal body P-ring formation chaperone FlgA [Pseudorhodoplanes sp.]